MPPLIVVCGYAVGSHARRCNFQLTTLLAKSFRSPQRFGGLTVPLQRSADVVGHDFHECREI
jgi:hypothetical protein